MILAVFLTLMCIISLILHNTMVMTVHNQYPDIRLVSPIYFCNRGKRYKYRVKRVHDGVVMKIGFRFDLDQDEFGGIMMYEVQRNVISNHQSSAETVSVKAIEEALKMMRLLVTWKIEHSGEPKVKIMMIEYGNGLVLNEDKLAQLYEKINDIPSDHNTSGCTWLMCDNTALTVIHEIVRKAGLELKLTVSQGARDMDTIRPMWIDSERQVLLEIVIYFC
jgi:hypothetical protein